MQEQLPEEQKEQQVEITSSSDLQQAESEKEQQTMEVSQGFSDSFDESISEFRQEKSQKKQQEKSQKEQQTTEQSEIFSNAIEESINQSLKSSSLVIGYDRSLPSRAMSTRGVEAINRGPYVVQPSQPRVPAKNPYKSASKPALGPLLLLAAGAGAALVATRLRRWQRFEGPQPSSGFSPQQFKLKEGRGLRSDRFNPQASRKDDYLSSRIKKTENKNIKTFLRRLDNLLKEKGITFNQLCSSKRLVV